ncbi:MAG: alginate export family protein [Candidatus Hydrogenedentes bacterium]|nr:alginate export family protein [Candidatus Hydrogenedentota bacterium]
MYKHLVIAITTLILCAEAGAELQNVSIGGQLRIRGRYWSNVYTDSGRETRIPDFFLPNRPIGPFGVSSRYGFDEKGNTRTWVEQTTKLRISADFTNYVNAVIELDDFEIWGEDFRSDYLTGADIRSNSSNDVELLQSYIETNETFGMPLRMRVGRQQIKLGSGWLVGETQSQIEIAFDGLRLTYCGDGYAIDGWYTKLAERGASEQDGDVDFYGLSASCTAVEGQEFLVYWLYLRDAASLNDTNFVAPIERLEDIFDLDDYGATNLHTVGARAAGGLGSFDYVAEAAYQFGDADSVGSLFKNNGFVYGDDSAEFSAWGGDAEIGYSFEEMVWTPRVYLGGAYFGGEDNRDITFLEWLNPFDRPEASVSFNRLFSSKRYYEFFDEGRNGTNFYQIRGGVEVHPTEKIFASLEVSKLGVNDTFDTPLTIGLGGWRVPVAPALSFLTEESGDDVGIVTGLDIEYQYSDQLMFRVTWNHMFVDDDVDEGNFVFANGLEFMGGSSDDDLDYFAVESRLRF